VSARDIACGAPQACRSAQKYFEVDFIHTRVLQRAVAAVLADPNAALPAGARKMTLDERTGNFFTTGPY
jgi:hypothetical protein